MSEWKEWEYTAPPMKPIIEQVVGQMHIEYENGAMKAVQEVGFNVDKDRLIQALTDASSFYEEGYRAAMSRSKWISVKEMLPEFRQEVLVVSDGKIYTAENMLTWEDGHVTIYIHVLGEWREFTHWMPLPNPPKEG